MMSNKRAASLATSLILLGCGGRTVSAGEDETGSTDTNELRSCEGPNAPSDPVELVGGEMQPGTFVRVGQRIYWADAWDEWSDEQPATTLYRTDLAAGEPWVAVAVDQPGINELVATADAIYWVVEGLSQPGGSLLRANLDDEIEILDDGLLSPRALTVGDANEWIYYVEGGDLAQANAKVLRIRPDGSSRQVIADSVGQIEDLAVDESHVWWVTPVTFEVWRADKGGGEVELIAELPNPAQIEVQGGFAWTLGLTGLYRISAGGEPDFVHGHGGPYQLAADTNHVYITMWNAFEETHFGWIYRHPISDAEIDGSNGEFVVDEFSPKPIAVRVDEHAIYWSTADQDSGQGAIWMLCKSAL